MKLLTKELEKKFEKYPLGSQEGKGSYAEVLVKYFIPTGSGTWLITEAEKQEDGDYLLFGYSCIFDWEWGYVLLSDLQNLELPYGLKVERDLYTFDQKYVKDFVDYPYKETIALKSGHYFLPVDKKEIPFFEKLKQLDSVVEYDSNILEIYDAFDVETSNEVDKYFGKQMGYEIDKFKVEDYEL